MKKWRPKLVGRPFVIKTDHQSLKYLLEQRVGTPVQQKWITKLLGYAFIVKYKHGKENSVANALSRRDEDLAGASTKSFATAVGTLCMISFPTPTWLFYLKSSYAADPTVQNIVQAIQSRQFALKGFTSCNDLLFYKGRLYLGQFNGDLGSVWIRIIFAETEN